MANLEQMREGWNAFAESYDEAITPFSTMVAEDALRIAGVGPGLKLLDIASGGGALSLPAARLGADVLAADFSPAMVERLRRKAAERGLSNLEAREMDGTALELDDGSFDVVCSQWGIMLFPDRRKGLQEMARVTRPGGKGVMVVFGPAAEVPLFSLFFQSVRAVAPESPLPESSSLFSLQDPRNLREEMEEAGFAGVRVTTQRHDMAVESADVLWNTIELSAPATAGLVRRLTPDQRAAARAKIGELLREQHGDGPYLLPTTTHVGIGVR